MERRKKREMGREGEKLGGGEGKERERKGELGNHKGIWAGKVEWGASTVQSLTTFQKGQGGSEKDKVQGG